MGRPRKKRRRGRRRRAPRNIQATSVVRGRVTMTLGEVDDNGLVRVERVEESP